MTRACIVCGEPLVRFQYPKGRENSVAWRKRTTCGGACAHEAARRTIAANAAIRAGKTTHEPCHACGEPVPRKPDEKLCRWLSRKACSPECTRKLQIAAGSTKFARPISMTPTAIRHREARAAIREGRAIRSTAVERRVAFDRFPTPDTIRPTWQTVTGDALPTVEWSSRATESTQRPSNLADALAHHPELAAALAGILSDAWVPYSRGSGAGGSLVTGLT